MKHLNQHSKDLRENAKKTESLAISEEKKPMISLALRRKRKEKRLEKELEKEARIVIS